MVINVQYFIIKCEKGFHANTIQYNILDLWKLSAESWEFLTCSRSDATTTTPMIHWRSRSTGKVISNVQSDRVNTSTDSWSLWTAAAFFFSSVILFTLHSCFPIGHLTRVWIAPWVVHIHDIQEKLICEHFSSCMFLIPQVKDLKLL